MSVRHLAYVLGIVLLALAAALAFTAALALVHGDGDAAAFAIATVFVAAAGLVGYRFGAIRGDLNIREGYAVVSLSWIAIAIGGALPYVFAGTTDSFVAALFESASGFTTTGATIFGNIEVLPHGILFWRALTQWIGGMGIIVLGIAILPVLGIGGMQLFRAEVPGPTPERLKPRIAQTAKLLWYVYAGLTAMQVALYMLGDMPAFEAVTHAMTTLSTGGFSPKNASIAAYGPYIQYVTIAFMYLAGINFALHYRVLMRSANPASDPEWRFFTSMLVGATLVMMLLAFGSTHGARGFEPALRDALFQVVSITTTTGFVTYDYELWPFGSHFLLVLLMLMGGMAGSTAGGMKAMRVYVLLRLGLTEVKKSVHPHAVIATRLGRTAIDDATLLNIVGFILLFISLFAAGALAMTLLGHDLVTAIGASAATIANIGPGLGEVGAVDNYGWLDPASQGVLIFLMIVGRLEIFTVLLLFHPDLWRRLSWRA
ncbi:MAG: TrkH family potassium uptake protein [Longimicrobiales bacterium]